MRTERIVVGVDGSPGSDAALEWAISEAGSAGAEIVAVHVVEPIIASAAVPTRWHFRWVIPARRTGVRSLQRRAMSA